MILADLYETFSQGFAMVVFAIIFYAMLISKFLAKNAGARKAAKSGVISLLGKWLK